jgi:hypothetical protein
MCPDDRNGLLYGYEMRFRMQAPENTIYETNIPDPELELIS